MKVLLVGLGQIGLGLIVPVFKKAGYTIVGTDASSERLDKLKNEYLLRTPGGVSTIEIDVAGMDDINGEFDLIITSVGRQHLPSVSEWLLKKNLSAPVLMAENLPDPVNLFPKQIPIVVDRICPRIKMEGTFLTVVAEDYYKIIVLDTQLTRRLGVLSGVDLEKSEAVLEYKRRLKMFTVNTSHVITALYGQRFNCSLVEEAAARPEVAGKIRSAIGEVSPWLSFGNREAEIKAREIIERFSSPIKDPLSRILGPTNRKSALRYIEVPLRAVKASGFPAPTLEEAYRIINSEPIN